jgi:hypothetical protein
MESNKKNTILDLIDLNIENYDLEDILNLFKIPSNFDENDLKNAKKMVLKMHPDKSHLDPEYFLFFSKAYKMVYRIWEYKNKDTLKKKSQEIHQFNKSSDSYKERKKVLDEFLDKNNYKDTKNFNQWFNEQFEKNKLETEDQSKGYGSWLKSDEDLDEIKILNPSQLAEEIDKKKTQLRAIIVQKEVSELDFFYKGATELTGEAPESYTSDLFSDLPFEDLRKAHTETVIPVTIEDFHAQKKFTDVNQYKQYRSSQEQVLVPLSEKQAKEYLNNKYKIQERETTERAYKLTKQMEESIKKQDSLWASMNYLKDKR